MPQQFKKKLFFFLRGGGSGHTAFYDRIQTRMYASMQTKIYLKFRIVYSARLPNLWDTNEPPKVQVWA